MHNIYAKDISEIKKHVPGNISISLEVLSPRIYSAQEKYIRPLISSAFHNELLGKYATGDLSEEEEELVNRIQYVCAHVAMLESIADMNVNMKQGGITVSVDDKNVAASGARVAELKTARTRDAQQGLDYLLAYLEENAASFTTYEASQERLNERLCFINTTDEINSFLTITINRWVLVKMRPVMRRTQLWYIKTILCQPLYDLMLQRISAREDLEEYAPLLPFIQRAVAHFSFAEAVEEMGIQIDANNGAYIEFQKNANEPKQTTPVVDGQLNRLINLNKKLADQSFMELKQHLSDNAADYSLYLESDCYAGTQQKGDYVLDNGAGHFLGTGF